MGILTHALNLNSILWKRSNVLVKNREGVRHTLSKFIEDGHGKLQIVSDFDYTLSRYCWKGKPCDSTYQVIEGCTMMPEDFRTQTAYLRAKYFPFYGNLRISEGAREEAMQAWLKQSHDLMRTFKVCYADIPQMVKLSSVSLRTEVVSFLSLASHWKIPVTVFSAGLSLVVREILQERHCLHENLTIVGNELLLNSKGEVAGVREPVVDGLNKSQMVSSRAEYFEKNKHRSNVVVIGDSTGDARVADKMMNVKNILKVGFFVYNQLDKSADIELYKDSFDIVVVDAETFTVVKELVQFLTARHEREPEELNRIAGVV